MQNIFAFCTICTKIYIKMICFLAVYLKIIIFAPTNMEQGRMILLRIAGRTTQGKAYFGKALSNLLSVKVIMSLIGTCKAKYKFRLTLKVPRCFCCQQVTACRPHDADRKAAWGVLQAARHTAGSADDEGCNCRSKQYRYWLQQHHYRPGWLISILMDLVFGLLHIQVSYQDFWNNLLVRHSEWSLPQQQEVSVI